MDTILAGRKTGRPIKIWVAPGPKHAAIARVVEELGGHTVNNAVIAQYAIVEQSAASNSRLFTDLKRENPEIRILSHRWLFDSKQQEKRLDLDGYEITRQPLPPAKKGTRTAFTPQDDMRLVKYLARYAKATGRLGHNLYDDVERRLPNHTASSWRQRYKTNQARLDYEISKYLATVQARRDNHENPYSDSEAEGGRSELLAKGSGNWPSKSQTTSKAKGKARADVNMDTEATRFPPLALQSSRRTAIKSTHPVQPTQATQGSSRQFRIDLDGPGERINFSDDDDSSSSLPLPSTSRLVAQTAAKFKDDQLKHTATSADKDIVEEQENSPIVRKRKRQRTHLFIDASSPVSQTDVTHEHTAPAEQRAPTATCLGGTIRETRLRRRLTSKSLPEGLSENGWRGLHMNTLLSADQMDDLVYVCSGDKTKALAVAVVLYESQLQGWSEERRKQVQALRKYMWTPEEDAQVLGDRLTAKLLERHGEKAIKARMDYLQKQHDKQTREEWSRRRFPYDDVGSL